MAKIKQTFSQFNTTTLGGRWNISNESDLNINSYNNESYPYTVIIELIARPILIILGTIGNCFVFIVMRRGSLKTTLTCFYMAILSLGDTGKFLILYEHF